MGNHQTGDAVIGHNLPGQSQHLIRCSRVKCGGVLVQQKELRRDHGGHEQGQRLPLAAGEQAYGTAHPILQSQPQLAQPLPELRPVGFGDHGEGVGAGTGPHIGKSQIFLNGHGGGGALQRILEHAPDELTALVVRQAGDVLPVQLDGATIHRKGSGDGVEEGGLARAVGAENGDEIALRKVQAQVGQSLLFVDGARVEGFGNV